MILSIAHVAFVSPMLTGAPSASNPLAGPSMISMAQLCPTSGEIAPPSGNRYSLLNNWQRVSCAASAASLVASVTATSAAPVSFTEVSAVDESTIPVSGVDESTTVVPVSGADDESVVASTTVVPVSGVAPVSGVVVVLS